MNAGRELDKLIAEKVMGLKDVRWLEGEVYYAPYTFLRHGELKLFGGKFDNSDDVPFYSTDLREAWKVVEKLNTMLQESYMKERARWPSTDPTNAVSITYEMTGQGVKGPFVTLKHRQTGLLNVITTGGSPAHAICLAALKAVGV